MKHLAAAMLIDALTRRSGVDGWKVELQSGSVVDSRIECEMVVKPPPGWVILHDENGGITPAKLPETIAFSFSFAEVAT